MFEVHINDRESLERAYFQSQLAAAICYQPTIAAAKTVAPKISVKDALWKTGHHTTLMHSNQHVSFLLDKIPVSLVTFGLHLQGAHYNTSQRSGRYCTSMFDSDYQDFVVKFIDRYTSLTSTSEIGMDILKWVKDGVKYFKNNLSTITEKARIAMKLERPNFNGDLDAQSQRIAQEQLRYVISTIFPTGMMYTINIPTLVALYECAWNVPLANLLKRMYGEVFGDEYLSTLVEDEDPDKMYHLASRRFRRCSDIPLELSFTPEFASFETKIMRSPKSEVFCTNGSKTNAEMFKHLTRTQANASADVLQFSPNANYIGLRPVEQTIRSRVSVSVATFGQDQRHRSIVRGVPTVTGEIYVPPLLKGHEKFFRKHMKTYLELAEHGGTENLIHFIPYGAVVSYVKEADTRAFHHETTKRLCLNAQEEIYYLSEKTIDQMFGKNNDGRPGPPCIIHGKCPEGKRYCGREVADEIDRRLI